MWNADSMFANNLFLPQLFLSTFIKCTKSFPIFYTSFSSFIFFLNSQNIHNPKALYFFPFPNIILD